MDETNIRLFAQLQSLIAEIEARKADVEGMKA